MDDEIDMASVDKADAVDLERETYYRDDPKKALKKYFDREGDLHTYKIIVYTCMCVCTCAYVRTCIGFVYVLLLCNAWIYTFALSMYICTYTHVRTNVHDMYKCTYMH